MRGILPRPSGTSSKGGLKKKDSASCVPLWRGIRGRRRQKVCFLKDEILVYGESSPALRAPPPKGDLRKRIRRHASPFLSRCIGMETGARGRRRQKVCLFEGRNIVYGGILPRPSGTPSKGGLKKKDSAPCVPLFVPMYRDGDRGQGEETSESLFV